MKHVLPLGYDHVLFVVALFLYDSKLKTAILQCSLFTLAHSITLAIVAIKLVSPPTVIVEAGIAFSIALMAIENIILKKVNIWRLVLIFTFGLVHGMGFANALLEVGLDKKELILDLVGFNIGVELAQIFIILLCYFLVRNWLEKKDWYQGKVVSILNILIGSIGIALGVERLII